MSHQKVTQQLYSAIRLCVYLGMEESEWFDPTPSEREDLAKLFDHLVIPLVQHLKE